MGMPKSLVLVRHGQSEGNVIQKQAKAGIFKEFPKEYLETPDREIRLSELGRQQTIKTANFLKQEYPQGFDVVYVSDHTRAKETAALVCKQAGWHNVEIRIDPQLGERNWGLFHLHDDEARANILRRKKRDPLHNPMPDGETLISTRHRTRVMLDRCSRQYVGKNVLVFSHGEYIEAIWSEIAHMRTEQQKEFFESPEGDIKNCQIVEFKTEPDYIKLYEVRSSNPDLGVIGSWSLLKRVVFNPDQLLAEVDQYPHILKK